jgi:hypothetical protein
LAQLESRVRIGLRSMGLGSFVCGAGEVGCIEFIVITRVLRKTDSGCERDGS